MEVDLETHCPNYPLWPLAKIVDTSLGRKGVKAVILFFLNCGACDVYPAIGGSLVVLYLDVLVDFARLCVDFYEVFLIDVATACRRIDQNLS